MKEKNLVTEAVMQDMIYNCYSHGNTIITIPCCEALGWESDMLVVTRAFFCHEFEIKLSRKDFLSDKKKEKHKHIKLHRIGEKFYEVKTNWGNYKSKVIRPANYFWYVCPKDLIKAEEVPEYAGLIYYDDNWLKTIKKAPRLHNEKLGIKELMSICRSVTCKYWNQRLK